MTSLKVILCRSLIGRPETQRKTIQSLGLRKINSFSIFNDSPTLRGQIHKVRHLVKVEEVATEVATEVAEKIALTKK